MSWEYVRDDKPWGHCWITARMGVWKAIPNETRCVGICARVLGCSVSGYDLPPLLLGLADFIMTVSHGIGPREFHLVFYGC